MNNYNQPLRLNFTLSFLPEFKKGHNYPRVKNIIFYQSKPVIRKYANHPSTIILQGVERWSSTSEKDETRAIIHEILFRQYKSMLSSGDILIATYMKYANRMYMIKEIEKTSSAVDTSSDEDDDIE